MVGVIDDVIGLIDERRDPLSVRRSAVDIPHALFFSHTLFIIYFLVRDIVVIVIGAVDSGDKSSGRCANPIRPYRFRVAEHRSYALEPLTLWMDSWQIRDNIPIGCGWLWIPSAGYPPSPPGVHEAIHELRGHCAGYPQPSTRIHDISTDLPTTSMMARDTDLEELCTRYPRHIHAMRYLSTQLSTGRWACRWSSGGWHGRLLMHTRAELSTNPGLLSTLTRNGRRPLQNQRCDGDARKNRALSAICWFVHTDCG